MNRPRPARPNHWDPRADSPMQENIDVARPTSTREAHSDEPTAPRPDAPPSGFTAVNGDRHVSSFRSDASVRASKPQNGDYGKSSTSEPMRRPSVDRPVSWRPGEPPDVDHAVHMNKRKRTDSTGHEASRNSPRPATAAVVTESSTNGKRPAPVYHPTAGLRSPERTGFEVNRGMGAAMIPTYAREQSPDSTRWNNGEPPPPPRPHIEAGLVESVRREHLSLRNPGRVPHTPPDGAHPPEEVTGVDSGSPSPEVEVQELSPGGTPTLPRKRMFSNRTKTGCHTCRARKKKCDETRPLCRNCVRGDFHCKGYGPKRPGDEKVERAKQGPGGFKEFQYNHMTPHMLVPHLPPQGIHPSPRYYFPPDPAHPHQGPSHWDRASAQVNIRPRQEPAYNDPTPVDYAQSNSNQNHWPQPGGPAHTASERRLSSDYYLPPPVPSYTSTRPPEPWNRPPPEANQRPPTASGSVVSGHDSATSNSGVSQQIPLSYQPSGEFSERSKMITGQPYRHFLDDELLRDRNSCKRAIEAYNDASRASSTVSPAEKERLFMAVLDPSTRTYDGDHALCWQTPKGSCGARTIVECPFTCEFGYNVHFGNDAVISRNCHMQDSCDIYIGNRTVVGPNVKFYCMTTDLDAGLRRGSQGNFRAGVIRIEDDVYIGGDSIIMPFRTVGKGAVIGAGSVVTKDVKPYTVVAGNPAKFVRRVEPGNNDERHINPDIQEQNERMQRRMQSGLDKGYRDRVIR